MMYVIFNEHGAIKDKQINEWIVQGSNNVNKIGVAIDGVDPTSFALVGVCKLPNGEVITTAPVDEQAEIIDGVYGVVFSLTKDITALQGTLRINIQAINTTTDKIITSYTVFLCVNEGVDPGEIVMMTADQYQDLLSKIELDVQQDETILTFNALPSAENYSVGQVIYVRNSSVKKLYECISNNDTLEWHETFDFNDHYTKDEIDGLLAQKSTVSGTYQDNSWKTITIDGTTKLIAGGGGSSYEAGYGISISDFQISVDTTEIATKLELNGVAEIADGKCKGYVINTQSQITGTKDNDDNYTGVTAITGVVLTDLHIGDIIYIKELNVPDYWVSALVYSGDTLQSVSLNKMETSKVDLTDYVDLDSAQTITGNKTFTGYFDVTTIRNNNSTKIVLGSDIIGYTTLRPNADNALDLGTSTRKWKDGYLSGQVYAQNTFNVINASDIVNNTLTQAQYDLITNGKPTLIKGTWNNIDNGIIQGTQIVGTYTYFSIKGFNNDTICIEYAGYINNSTKLVNLYTSAGGLGVSYNGFTRINNKNFPAYPTTNTSPQVLTIAANGGALSWETFQGLTNPMTTAGDIIYGGADGTPTRLGIGETYAFLRVNNSQTGVEYKKFYRNSIHLSKSSSSTSLDVYFDYYCGQSFSSSTYANFLQTISALDSGRHSFSGYGIFAGELMIPLYFESTYEGGAQNLKFYFHKISSGTTESLLVAASDTPTFACDSVVFR